MTCAIGRFMQNDLIGYAGGMNLYRYCNNNPTNFVDPMGLATTTCNQSNPVSIPNLFPPDWWQYAALFQPGGAGFPGPLMGQNSGNRGETPRKGKPPKVKHLNKEEFLGKFDYVIERMKKYSRYNAPRSWWFLPQADSNFHKDMNLYEYDGLTMRGNWWNYYMQGIAHAYFGYDKWQMRWHIYTWRWGHILVGELMPVTDELLEAADKGYDDWLNGRTDYK